MPGNSERRGAMRKDGTKKGPVVGSGGQRSKGLEGRGPTPKAADRPKHKANRSATANARRDGGTASRPSASSRRTAAEVVVGRNPVVESLRAGIPASALYVAERVEADERVRECLRLAADRGLAILEVPRAEIDRMADGAFHQGLALAIPAYEYAEPGELLARAIDSGQPPLFVALDGVTDPRNLGATVRSAAAFGAHGVIVPERRSASMTATAWKASAGAAVRVPVARATNLSRTLASYAKAGCFVVGLDGGGEVDLSELDPGLARGGLVLVVGAEGKGLSRLVAERADVRVRVPIAASTESLNASVAIGIALYEVARIRSR